jgi:HSP20 family molecular chaperone IbpA
MLAQALMLIEESDRLRRQSFHLGKAKARGPSWEPPVDMFESPGAITILMALPGVSPSEVEVVVDEGGLFVVGERQLPVAENAVIRRLEIPYGRFERHIDLPSGHFEISERVLANGSLRLTLKKLA